MLVITNYFNPDINWLKIQDELQDFINTSKTSGNFKRHSHSLSIMLRA